MRERKSGKRGREEKVMRHRKRKREREMVLGNTSAAERGRCLI